MSELSRSLGVEGVFLYTPTALVVSITDEQGEATYLRRIDSGAVDVDKLIRFDETLERVEAKELSVSQASRDLSKIAEDSPPYPGWLTVVVSAISCGAVAIFFKGTYAEILSAAALGLVVAILEWGSGRLRWEPGLLEPIAGCVAAIGALCIAHFVAPIDDRLVTLSALIVMIPGLRITVALTELAVGHLSAGVARLAGGCVSLLTMTIGVALGWRILGSLRNLPEPPPADQPYWMLWLGILIAPITFSIVFRARWAAVAGDCCRVRVWFRYQHVCRPRIWHRGWCLRWSVGYGCRQ